MPEEQTESAALTTVATHQRVTNKEQRSDAAAHDEGNATTRARRSLGPWLVGGVAAGLLLLLVVLAMGRGSPETTTGTRASGVGEAGPNVGSLVESTSSGIRSSALSDGLCEDNVYYCDVSVEIVRTSEFAGVVTVDYAWTDGEVTCTERADLQVFDDGTLDIVAYGYEWDCGDDRHPRSVANEARIAPSDTEIEQAICESIPGTCELQKVETLRAWEVIGGGIAANAAVVMKFDGTVCQFNADLAKDLGLYPSGAWETISTVKGAYERCTS